MNTDFLILTALGSAVGAIMGLTGAGGGILSVPALVLLAHVPLQVASPAALSAISLSASIAAAIGLKRGLLRYRAAGLMAAAGLLASPLGLWLSQRLPAAPLQLAFGLILVATAINGFRKTQTQHAQNGNEAGDGFHGQTNNLFADLRAAAAPRPAPPPCQLDPTIGRLVWTNPCARALAGSGALAGFMAGLLGVGGGFVLIPALQRYTNLSQAAIVSTALGVLAMVTGGSAVMAAAQGRIDATVAVPFVMGSVIGLGIGKWMEPAASAQALARSFHALALGTGLLLVARTLS